MWWDWIICCDMSCVFAMPCSYWPSYELLHVLHLNLYMPLMFVTKPINFICYIKSILYIRPHKLITFTNYIAMSFRLSREEKPIKCHWMVYCTYNMLNMFRAILWSSSGSRDYMWFLPSMVCSAWLLVIGSGTEQLAKSPEKGIFLDA
jgi:hypothetical protein